jgi:hypothetical protein
VPDSTIDQWTFPPWSGHFDGDFIWGRGACDCKSLLISQLVAIESLIEKGFEPRRTILLSYGFDEESKGFSVSPLTFPFLTGCSQRISNRELESYPRESKRSTVPTGSS